MAPEVGLGLGRSLIFNRFYSERVANPALISNKFPRNLALS
jgi:hypothetical protein